jgi:fumarate reductase flavoprotein subunit
MQNNITRRSFIGGSVGAVGLGAIAASGTARAAEKVAASAEADVAEGVVKVGETNILENFIQESLPIIDIDAGEDDGVSPIAPLAAPDAWDEECDVVVVGTGGGGLAATTLAAQNGAKVITLEKLDEVGGNTREASYMECLGGSKFQNEQGLSFDPQALFTQYWPMYRDSIDVELFMEMISRGYVDIDWMGELGVDWDYDWTFTNRDGMGLCARGSDDGGLTDRMTQKIVDIVYAKAQEFGADVRVSTEVTGLVKDGDAIVGVRAVGPDGQYYVKADTAVILCAGNGEANRPMLSVYSPDFAARCGASMTYPSNDGKIVRMGFGAGADLAGYNSFAHFDGGLDWRDVGSWCQSLYGGYPALLRSPWLRINKQGKRTTYMDNTTQGGEMAATFQGCVEMSQPDQRVYVIFDQGWEERVPAFNQSGCRRPITPDMPDIDRVNELVAPHNWIDGANEAIEKGWIKSSDTIEGLAEELGLDPEIVKQAVDDWNNVCATGEDNPLYGYKSEWLIPIENGPFYGARLGGYSPACGCGLAVDAGMHVMGTDGNVIPGLYASFLTAGGGLGEDSYGLASPLGVNHLSWWSGYIAAETALGLEPRE